MKAVVLAGGQGARLAPYTYVLPKPLLPIDGRPITEHIVRRLAAAGFLDIHMAVGHRGGLVAAYFSRLKDLPDGVRLNFVEEPQPLGTAGPLRLVSGAPQRLLVTNGDVLSDIDYADLVAHHERSGAALTIATRMHRDVCPFGVVTLGDGGNVLEFNEKPTHQRLVNMGIYVYEPSALAFLREDAATDLPDLVQTLLQVGQRIVAYPFAGFWFDVGTPSDYMRAARHFEKTARIDTAPSEAFPSQTGASAAGPGGFSWRREIGCDVAPDVLSASLHMNAD